MKRDLDDRSITVGSDNVFADIGVSDPDLALKKSDLASKIRDAIREGDWTLTEAAEVMGLDQSHVSAIVHGRVGDYTLDRLIQLVMKLGQTVFVDVVGPDIERSVTRDRSGMVTVRYTAKTTSRTNGKATCKRTNGKAKRARQSVS
jgi:predicted XRE-type DNA-binding protein